MLVVGDREVENREVAVRLRSGENLGAQSLPDVIARIDEAVAAKRDL